MSANMCVIIMDSSIWKSFLKGFQAVLKTQCVNRFLIYENVVGHLTEGDTNGQEEKNG